MLRFQILNLFFHATHVLFVFFILTGWAFRKTRTLHLILMALTAFSWIGLGFFYGWGYCFWTDWHWRVRDRMGIQHPASYIKLLADTVTDSNWNAEMIDFVTAILFLIVIVVTIVVNLKRTRSNPS
jgi:hypothetical protein